MLNVKSKIAVFTVGRFQPPTKGHEVLIDKVAEVASEKGADAYVFVSDSMDSKKNPLDPATKVHYMNKMFGDKGVQIINSALCKLPPLSVPCNNYFKVLPLLRSLGYTELYVVVGSDRAEEEGTKSLLKYGVKEILTAGDVRNESSESVSGLSGTKMRAAAMSNNTNSFKKGTQIGSMTNENVTNLMKTIKLGLINNSRKRRRNNNINKNININIKRRNTKTKRNRSKKIK
jgi:hypothetical protein